MSACELAAKAIPPDFKNPSKRSTLLLELGARPAFAARAVVTKVSVSDTREDDSVGRKAGLALAPCIPINAAVESDVLVISWD
jgi:hypothetical protein